MSIYRRKEKINEKHLYREQEINEKNLYMKFKSFLKINGDKTGAPEDANKKEILRQPVRYA